MYFLLILIHLIFVIISHIFGFYLIEGAFIVLWIFFILYFSPVFFFKNQKNQFLEVFSFDFSPQRSLLLPLVLMYLWIYLLAFTFTGTLKESMTVHIMIFLGIYGILVGYMLTFYWKSDIFFDISRFHLLYSYITLIIIGIYFSFYPADILFLHIIFMAIVLGYSVFFFGYSRKEKVWIFQLFLVSMIIGGTMSIQYLFPNLPLYILTGLAGVVSLVFFEQIPKIRFFQPYLFESKVFFLSIVLISSLVNVFLSFFVFESSYFLILFTMFLFSVHARYSNYIAYISAIVLLYYLYGFLFFNLLHSDSILSSLIFIFFFPIVIIANTYFWEEKYPYDFSILHYWSIAYSVGFSIYASIFLSWWDWLLFFISLCIFLIAFLFFFSYFRFRYR